MDPDNELFGFQQPTYGPVPRNIPPPSPPQTPPPPLPEDAVPPGSPYSNSTSIMSIQSDEDTTGYYREVSGRMFHAFPDTPTVLPSDYAEVRRVNDEHELYKLVLDGIYWGPVEEVLSPVPGRTRRGLDVISTSPWLDEMAEEFPHVKWYGCQFVPTRHPHQSNVVYEVYNVNEGLHGADGSFDLVHARLIRILMSNPDRFFSEVHRVLRPGGLFLYADLDPTNYVAYPDGDVDSRIPWTVKISNIVLSAMSDQGVRPADIPYIAQKLRKMGGFNRVEHYVTSIPVGPWDTSSELQQEIGMMCAQNLSNIASSFEPLMHRRGATQAEIDEITTNFRAELVDPTTRFYVRYNTICAFKDGDEG